MLESCYYFVGKFAPLILLFYSFFLLWHKENLFFYYTIGIFMNAVLNLVLKGIIQQPRPIDDPKLFKLALTHVKPHVFKTSIPFNIYGMPSGHAQSSLFRQSLFFSLCGTLKY